MAEVRSWEYGLLILNREEGRGVDSRFKRDAMVLMSTEVSDYHELQQMVGRSSRTRGICQGTLYVISQDKPQQVAERLRTQGVVVL